MFLCLTLTATVTAGGSQRRLPGLPEKLTKSAGCLIAAGGVAIAARAAALKEAKRRGLSAEQTKELERGYMIGFALYGCAAGAALAGTVHEKLSERGRRNREAAMQMAAESAAVQTYRDPEVPRLAGTVSAGPTFVESGRECRTIEDLLAEGDRSDPVFMTYCKNPSTGAWSPA
jgi:hypothetical protein